MGNVSSVIVDRLARIEDATQAVLRYDVDDRIVTAQFEMEFEEGIKVANEVTAEMIADLHHLFDYHGQDWEALLADADAKYRQHSEAVGS